MTGTAVYIAALHQPVVPKIQAGNSFNESSEKLAELQRTIQNTVEKNRERYHLTSHFELTNDQIHKLNKNLSDTEDSDNEEKLDYTIGNKQTCIMEIDDIQDLELYSMLTEQYAPEGIDIVNTQNVPGLNVEYARNFQTFVQGNYFWKFSRYFQYFSITPTIQFGERSWRQVIYQIAILLVTSNAFYNPYSLSCASLFHVKSVT